MLKLLILITFVTLLINSNETRNITGNILRSTADLISPDDTKTDRTLGERIDDILKY